MGVVPNPPGMSQPYNEHRMFTYQNGVYHEDKYLLDPKLGPQFERFTRIMNNEQTRGVNYLATNAGYRDESTGESLVAFCYVQLADKRHIIDARGNDVPLFDWFFLPEADAQAFVAAIQEKADLIDEVFCLRYQVPEDPAARYVQRVQARTLKFVDITYLSDKTTRVEGEQLTENAHAVPYSRPIGEVPA